jgi:hypothetical protein
VCQLETDGTVRSVETGSGLTGGPITTSGTISIGTGGVTSAHIADGTVGSVDVNPAQVQLRVTGTCATGSAIRVVDQNGTVTCQSLGSGVTDVTASAPLVSSGGTTPNISLPNVKFDGALNNTAIGISALQSNTTGVANVASGFKALFHNTSGEQNTANGAGALASNTGGSFNTASGIDALSSNISGSANTASGGAALTNNTTGNNNTASGYGALGINTTGNNNTASGVGALQGTSPGSTGDNNTASGVNALRNNTTSNNNTASGAFALQNNTTGNSNTAIGVSANVGAGNLTNATAIGAGAVVDDSNKIRLGNTAVTVIEGNVDFTFTSDQTKKENFQPVDGEEVLRKLRALTLTSWNYIGHDPKQFRHYGPMGQEFFAAFGHDAIGTIGSPTTLTASDLAGILMSAVQAIEKRTVQLREEKDQLKEIVEMFKTENDELRARLERLERTTTGYAR